MNVFTDLHLETMKHTTTISVRYITERDIGVIPLKFEDVKDNNNMEY